VNANIANFILVRSFVNGEKYRYQNVFYFAEQGLGYSLKGKCVARADGSSESDDFAVADEIEKIVIFECVQNCLQTNENRVPLLPRIMVSYCSIYEVELFFKCRHVDNMVR